MPRRPTAFSLAAFLMALLLLSGCEVPADEAPPIRVDVASEALARRLAAEAMTAGLTARNEAGLVVPALARSWRVSNDGLSIMFRLREANTLEGKPLLARDIVASLNVARRDPFLSELMVGVTRLGAPLPNVVEVGLSTPQPEFLELLATPELAIRAKGRPLVPGPFRLERSSDSVDGAGTAAAKTSGKDEGPAQGWPEGRSLLLVPDQRYHADATAERYRIRVERVSPETGISRFQRGESDLLLGGGIQGLGSARIISRRQALMVELPRAALMLLVNQSKSPLDDLRVRRALRLAIDGAVFGPRLFGTQAPIAIYGLSPPGLDPYPGIRPPEWFRAPMPVRIAEARRLLAEAGHGTGGAPLTLMVAIGDRPSEARVMSEVAAMLSAVGVEVRLARRSVAAHDAAVAKGDFELALVRQETGYASPLPFLLSFRCGANRHGVCLPEADQSLAQSWSAPDLEKRMEALAMAERLWSDDVAAIGLVRMVGWSLVSERVRGFTPNAGGLHSLAHLGSITRREFL